MRALTKLCVTLTSYFVFSGASVSILGAQVDVARQPVTASTTKMPIFQIAWKVAKEPCGSWELDPVAAAFLVKPPVDLPKLKGAGHHCLAYVKSAKGAQLVRSRLQENQDAVDVSQPERLPLVGGLKLPLFRVVWRFSSGEPCEPLAFKLPDDLYDEIPLMGRPGGVASVAVVGTDSSLLAYCHAYVQGEDNALELRSRLFKTGRLAGMPEVERLSNRQRLDPTLFKVLWLPSEGSCEAVNAIRQEDIDTPLFPDGVFSQFEKDEEFRSYCHAYVQGEEATRRFSRQLKASAKIVGAPLAEELPSLQPLDLAFEVEDAALPQDGCQQNEEDASPKPTPSFRHLQEYLDEADQTKFRLDASAGWSTMGGCGSEGVTLVDLDVGWSPHEELGFLDTIVLQALPFNHHGTAVLGICVAPHDGRGIDGIAPHIRVRPVSLVQRTDDEPPPSPDVLIAAAAQEITTSGGAGVILIEEGTSVWLKDPLGWSKKLPYEALEVVRDAIVKATEKAGVYVVEVAGNGGYKNLAALTLENGRRIENGPAIMVGGGDPVTLRPTGGTNQGPQVDVGAWGEGVVTAGGLGHPYCSIRCRSRHEECYTRFSGTSSAAAIVAGVVTSLAGIAEAHGNRILTQAEMLMVLQASNLRWSPDDGDGGIGVMPNLKQALVKMKEVLGVDLVPAVLGNTGGCP